MTAMRRMQTGKLTLCSRLFSIIYRISAFHIGQGTADTQVQGY